MSGAEQYPLYLRVLSDMESADLNPTVILFDYFVVSPPFHLFSSVIEVH